MKIFNKEITYTTIKDNIGTLIIVPTLLGGIWQLFELLVLGTPYIRFFSVSQLVSDGLLVLFVMLIFFLGIRLVYSIDADAFERVLFSKKDETDTSSDLVNKKFVYKIAGNTRKDRFLGLLSFSLGCATSVYLFYPFHSMGKILLPFGRSLIQPPNIFAASTVIAVAVIILGLMIRGVLAMLSCRLNFQNNGFREALRYFRVLIFISCIPLMVKLPSYFHQAFLLPENLRNKEYIWRKVKLNNPQMKNCDLAYFNDKFVFIAIEDSSNKKLIEVIEFDALFSVQDKEE